VVEVDDPWDVQRDALSALTAVVARRRLRTDDAEHGQHPGEVPDRRVKNHGHLYRTTTEIGVAKVDAKCWDEQGAAAPRRFTMT
jgi:hypothetical protein